VSEEIAPGDPIQSTLPISYVDSDKRSSLPTRLYRGWFGRGWTAKKVDDVLGSASYEAISGYVDAVLRGEEITMNPEIAMQGTRETRFLRGIVCTR